MAVVSLGGVSAMRSVKLAGTHFDEAIIKYMRRKYNLVIGQKTAESAKIAIGCVLFDNAFHSTMPDYAYLYAIPYELYEKYHVRRYGFHGTSHRYVSKRVCEILGLDQNNSKIITCHIGNGGSVAAVLNGKVLDTSMGLTPLAGLMMGSRCGDIDASAVTYLMDKLNMKPQEMADFLNKKSGVLGITGISSDMRDIENAANEGNEKAQLALRTVSYTHLGHGLRHDIRLRPHCSRHCW